MKAPSDTTDVWYPGGATTKTSNWCRDPMTIPAKYEDGVFKPLAAVVKIKEGTVVDVYVPQEEQVKPRSIRDLGFAGMWAYRDDITDGLSYVNNLRDHPRD